MGLGPVLVINLVRSLYAPEEQLVEYERSILSPNDIGDGEALGLSFMDFFN